MLVSAIYSECGRLLADPNNDRWVAATLLARINLASTHILSLTNAIKTVETLNTVAGTEEVALDSDVMDVVRVHIKNTDGEWKPLVGILRDQLDFEDPNWQQRENAGPVRWSWDGTTQKIILVPPPSADWAGTGFLKAWTIQNPTALTLSSETPFAGNAAMIPYHMAIVHWVVAQCWMDDGTPEALSKARFHRSDDFSRPGKFEAEIKKIRAKFDAPENINSRILWRPQGGRASRVGNRSKANPLSQ
jgi:hypothetical protein